jgi:membrane associated rhomboid family serine protease
MSQTQKQPFLKAPFIILVLIAGMVIVQAVMATGGQTVRISFIVEMGLFPARFFAEGLGGLPGGLSQGMVTLFTYAFVHGGWAHCLINAAFLLAFGSPVTKRLGARRFFYLFALCVILAGLGQIFLTAREAYLIPIIGASGGVAGMVGAASRFAFTQGNWPSYAAGDQRRRLLAL